MDDQALPAPVPPYFGYWGKARPAELQGGTPCHLLPYHCLDVAATGREYLRRAHAFRAFLGRCLAIEDEEVLLSWVSFWLSLHDLGKYSEAFQSQRPDLFVRLRGRMPHPAKAYTERHDSLGMKFWAGCLQQRAWARGWFGPHGDLLADGLACWAGAVTGHHGQPPRLTHASPGSFFDMQQDGAAIEAFAQAMHQIMVSPAAVDLLAAQDPDAFWRRSVTASWWLAGLAVLADWIGSNTDFFIYHSTPDVALPDYWLQAQAVAERALRQSGVLPAARQDATSFATLFPSLRTPSPLQAWASSVPLDEGPQLLMLEDVTGAGKTEAAVMLAHRLMAAGCADGFFIGLPTMATANAMYGRIANVYARLFAGDASLVLAHGRKTLVEDFAASVLAPGIAESDPQQRDETATARCTSWLADHNKRALLAPAGVGTIDQALLAALQSRHQSLRLLGLFRKVLVVDEVHACDAYMQRTLETLLGLHAHAGGSAILLSATLPQRMKQSLLDAFARGCGAASPALAVADYPLTTCWSAQHAARAREVPVATRPDVRRHVTVRYCSRREEVVAAIVTALRGGRCVAWIRNTIADAIDARAELLRHVPPESITLFHARFALGDRLDIEERVLGWFGSESTAADRAGRLLIATQVAEQSLDVDFDLVVSDLAPIDRLIQRAGRLHRHRRDAQGNRLAAGGASDERGAPCLWVFGPEWQASPAADWFKQAFPKAARVYAHHGQLWLTARALQDGGFRMPDDARALIESVFGDESLVPEGLQHSSNQAEGKAYGDESLAQLNSIKLECGYERSGNEWAADAVAPSRLGEETIELVLARWQGDQLVPWRSHAVERHAWAYSSVRVPRRLIAEAALAAVPARLAALEDVKQRLPGQGRWAIVLAFEHEHGVFRASASGLAHHGQTASPKAWRYDSHEGLRADTAAVEEE